MATLSFYCVMNSQVWFDSKIHFLFSVFFRTLVVCVESWSGLLLLVVIGQQGKLQHNMHRCIDLVEFSKTQNSVDFDFKITTKIVASFKKYTHFIFISLNVTVNSSSSNYLFLIFFLLLMNSQISFINLSVISLNATVD